MKPTSAQKALRGSETDTKELLGRGEDNSTVKKIIDLLEGIIKDPWSGKHYYLLIFPATPLCLSQTLEGLLELTQRPSSSLNLPRALHAEVLGPIKKPTQTLIVRLLKMHVLFA